MSALKAYLPGLARAVLGEELMVESVPTFWCGDPQSLSLTLGGLDDMVIKPASVIAAVIHWCPRKWIKKRRPS